MKKRKRLRKVLAIALTMAMVMGMGLTASADFASSDPSTSTADVTVSGLQSTTTKVSAYKFISASYANGVVTYSLKGWAADALAGVDAAKKNGTVDVDTVITGLGGTIGGKNATGGQTTSGTTKDQKDSNGILAALASVAVSQTADREVANSLFTNDSDNKGGKTATFTGLAVGSYLVLATDGTLVYNPMLISVGLTADSTTGKINGVQANGAVAKYSSVSLGKKTTNQPTDGNNSTNNDGNEAEDKGGDLQVGEKVYYELTSKIPNYDTKVYTNFTFKIVDTLSKGLTAPNLSDVTVKVGEGENNTIILTDISEMEDTSNVTDPTYKKETNSKTGETTITIDLSPITEQHLDEDVVVTYSAILNQNADTGFDPNTNSAHLEYSNGPNTEARTDPASTNTYTFAIDGSILGNVTGTELTKTGEEKAAEGNTEYQPLEGAEFTLTEVLEEGSTADPKTWTATTDVSGYMNFVGLDAGEYTLQETKAPNGYSINNEVYTIKFVPEYDTDGKMTEYTVKVNEGKDDEYSVTYAYKAATEEGAEASIETIYNTTKMVDDEEVTVKTEEIKNTKLTSLPSTGGIGTTIFTIGGIVIMVVAAALFFANRKKKNV